MYQSEFEGEFHKMFDGFYLLIKWNLSNLRS